MRPTNRPFYRLPREGKVAGVCAGIADYFNLETWLVRIIFVTGVLLSGAFFVVAYIAAWFILDVKPGQEKTKGNRNYSAHYGNRSSQTFADGRENETQEQYQAQFEQGPIEVKQKVWQAGEPPRQAFHDIVNQFNDLEKRLQNLERYVTSTEFTVAREINRL